MTEFFVGDKVRVELPRGYSKRGVLGISVLYTTWPEARFEGATGRITEINPVGPYSVATYLVDFRAFDNSRLGIPWQAQWFREEWMTLLERGTLAEPPVPPQPGPRTGAEDSASPIHGGTAPGGDDRTPAQAQQERNRMSTGAAAGERRAEPQAQAQPPRTEAVGSGTIAASEPPAAVSEPLVAPTTGRAPHASAAVDANDEIFLEEPPAESTTPGASEPTWSGAVGGDRVGRGAGLLGEPPGEPETVNTTLEPAAQTADTASAREAEVVVETDLLIVEEVAPAERRQHVTSGPGWIRVKGSGVCPDGYPIKGNAKSKIFHRPTDDSFAQTVPEICFESEEAAIAAGYRPRAAGRPGMGGKKDPRKPRH